MLSVVWRFINLRATQGPLDELRASEGSNLNFPVEFGCTCEPVVAICGVLVIMISVVALWEAF